MTAVGIVLVSSVIFQTTDVTKLVQLTRYSQNFISAVAFNMNHNKLWVGDQYDESQYLRWFSPAGSSAAVRGCQASKRSLSIHARSIGMTSAPLNR